MNLKNVQLDEAPQFVADDKSYTVKGAGKMVYRAKSTNGVAFALSAPEAVALIRELERNE